ncbi:MAG: DUF2273 domain-containing protein [Christensenellales bacterium]
MNDFNLKEFILKHKVQAVGVALGVLAGVLILLIGLLRTLFLVLCGIVGYAVAALVMSDTIQGQRIRDFFKFRGKKGDH